MNIIFYIASIVAIFASIMVITRRNPVHALLNMIVMLLAVSVLFYILGAQFVAALEVIVYAGAIMVLFIFVVMMLNLSENTGGENKWLAPKMWILPTIMVAILLVDFIFFLKVLGAENVNTQAIHPKQVGISLFTTYIIAVELAGMLLLAGIVGAYHISKQKKIELHRYLNQEIKDENIK
jgi:NADH-quinone oxidoreductase subunit J